MRKFALTFSLLLALASPISLTGYIAPRAEDDVEIVWCWVKRMDNGDDKITAMIHVTRSPNDTGTLRLEEIWLGTNLLVGDFGYTCDSGGHAYVTCEAYKFGVNRNRFLQVKERDPPPYFFDSEMAYMVDITVPSEPFLYDDPDPGQSEHQEGSVGPPPTITLDTFRPEVEIFGKGGETYQWRVLYGSFVVRSGTVTVPAGQNVVTFYPTEWTHLNLSPGLHESEYLYSFQMQMTGMSWSADPILDSKAVNYTHNIHGGGG